MEQKPEKKEQLQRANYVLAHAIKLIKVKWRITCAIIGRSGACI